MADISLIQDVCMDDSDEGVFEQGDCSSSSPVDDEVLPPLSRVKKYFLSANVYDRQLVARIVQALFKTAPPAILTEDLPKIMAMVQNLGEKDEPMVRMDLLEQIPHMASNALKNADRVEALNNIMGDYLIPLVVRNLGCTENAVDKVAHTTIITLLVQGLVSKTQAEIQVCPAILALSNEEQTADIHTGAITLMSKMAPHLGRDVTERVFLKRFSQLCASNMFYVRKVCASHLGDFCAVIGTEQFEKILLPCYLALCQDDIWGVRKSCAEVIMFVSSVCPPDIRRTTLAPAFAKLLQDDCRWVQMSAFQTLGPFISTFADPPITKIGYNTVGELVFTSKDGNEFLINSPPSVPDVRFCKFLPKQPSQISNVDNPESSCLSEGFDKWWELNEEELDYDTKSNLYEYLKLDNPSVSQSDEDIKEIVETVKNAVLNYRKVEQELSVMDDELENKLDNLNVISDIKSTTCDNIDRNINELNEGEKVVEKTELSGTLEKNDSNLGSNEEFADTPKNEMTEQWTCTVLSNELKDGLQTMVLREIEDITESLNSESSVEWKNATGDVNNSNVVHNEPKIEINDVSQVTFNKTSENEDENLALFNSYNYWYISPPDIISDLINVEEGKFTQNHLDDHNAVVTSDNSYSEDSISISNLSYNLSEVKIDSDGSGGAKELAAPSEPEQDIVPQILINNFILMTDSSFAITIDHEMSYHCAYSLPAVALTLENKNWPLLKQTIERLAIDMQYKVRRTLASCLHELALILGRDIATEHLAPIFGGFIKDLDEVRIGILKHLAYFLRLIKPAKRLTYLPRLQEFLKTENEWNWRFRHELGQQLLLIVTLFNPVDSAKHIGLVAESLLQDVAAVREIAISLVTELLRHVSTKPGLNSLYLVRLVEKFALSKNWKRRQTFALLCDKLLSSEALPPDQFASEIMPHLLDLSWDPVANVRLVVAKTLAQHVIPNEYFSQPNNEHLDSLGTVIRRLQADKDHDVRHHAKIICSPCLKPVSPTTEYCLE